jgi:hypothetical protein
MKTIPTFKLVPEPVTDEARHLPKFRWAGKEVGTRHQLGGPPARPISDDSWPHCQDCNDRMTFYGQLDSINDEFCIADAGLIYVFICFECNEVKAIIETS